MSRSLRNRHPLARSPLVARAALAPEVADIEVQLRHRDGPFHVGGRYYATVADDARRQYAERLRARALHDDDAAVAELVTLFGERLARCRWCDKPMAEHDRHYANAGAWMHGRCRDAYRATVDDLVAGGAPPVAA